MSNNNLAKAFSLQLENDQDKALEILKNKGFNKCKFIRAAVEEKLYKDFRNIIKQLNKPNKTVPEWAL